MADNIFDLIGQLMPRVAPAALGAPPILQTAIANRDALAQWAAVPPPPQDPGQLIARLGDIYNAGNRLGTAAGTIAFNPLLARAAQIANAPGLANIPLPGVAGNLGMSLAGLSLLPGGQQVAEGLGLPPPNQGYGDVIGPAYQAAAEQGGGLAGLGAALDRLAEIQHATPEVVPGSKFLAENSLNPLTFLPGARGVQAMGGPAGALIGAPARGAELAFQLPFEGVTALAHTPLAQRLGGTALSQYSQGVRESQWFQDMMKSFAQFAEARQTKTPEILGTEATDPRMQGASVFAAKGAPIAEDPLAQAANVAQAAEQDNAAQEAIRTTLQGVTPETAPAGAEAAGAAPSVVPGAAEVAGAVPAAAAVPDTGSLPLDLMTDVGHPLRWFNNRASEAYRYARTAFQTMTGQEMPAATDVPLGSIRAALDPQDQADTWLAMVLGDIQRRGVRPGEVVEEAAGATRRRSFLRGLGGDVGGQTSARTGELIFEPDTVGQVDSVVKRLQLSGNFPQGDAPRLATDLHWLEQRYGDTFPAPPTKEQPFWAAIQLHMDRLAGREPPVAPEGPGAVPPVEGLPSPAPPAAGGAVPEAMVPEAAPGVPPLAPEGAPPAAAPGVGQPPAGGVLPLEGVPPTPAPPAGAPSLPGALSPAADAELLAQEQALEQEIRRLRVGGYAPVVPDVVVDPLVAKLDAIRTIRQGPPVARGEIPPAPPPFEPPSLQPQGPLGGVAEVPPAPFEAGTTMRQDPAAAQELADALKSRDIIMRESQDPAERVAANQRVAAAQAGAQADLGAALPADLGVADLRAPQMEAYQQWLGLQAPGTAGRLQPHLENWNAQLPKFLQDLDSMKAFRAEAGLGPEATDKTIIQALQAMGSPNAGMAREITGRWAGDVLSGDMAHIAAEKIIPIWAKDRGIDLERLGGHPLVQALAAAWRAQALLSPAFHLKNVGDSVIKSFVDAQSPGFVADAKPWNPRDLGNAIKTAWQETNGQANIDRALSPALRVWGEMHKLPVYDEMFAARNPTLDTALAALSEADQKAVLSSLTPVERALIKMPGGTDLVTPTGIAEAAGPVAPGGVLSKVPGLNRALAFNLKLTIGMEQSARQAKFIDVYADAIQGGAPQYEAYQQGLNEANRLFFDYQGNLSNLDLLLRNVMGFHIFGSRNLQYWAPILASNPILIKALQGYDEWTNSMAEEGGYAANRRFAESVKLPLVGGVGGKIAEMLFSRQGQLFWNPMAYWGIAEQALSTPQEYRDEPFLGQALGKMRSFGLGLAPWADLPLQALGAYGARTPQSLTSVDTLLESAGQTLTGRPMELPWKTAQRARFPSGQAEPTSLDVGVRQRLREMALTDRPDFVRSNPQQPVAPEYARAMLEGPDNPLYQQAARSLGWERFVGTLAGKFVGGGPAFQSQTAADIAQAQGNPPRGPGVTPQERQRYQQRQLSTITPEQIPLITSGREAAVKNIGEPGSQPAGEPPQSKAAYIAANWPQMSAARQMALMQLANTDQGWKDAISTYLAGRARQHSLIFGIH